MIDGAELEVDKTAWVGFHATSVEINGAAVLIAGASGAGKSGLALQLIGLGARLIADDYSRIHVQNKTAFALAPQHLQGVIEARGVGLINVPWCSCAPLKLVVDMGQTQQERLPNVDQITQIAGCDVALVLRVDAPYFASAVYHLLRYGRYDETRWGKSYAR